MRVTESLLRQNQLNQKKKWQGNNEDDEPTQAYREKRQAYWALNQHKTVFDSALGEGINTKGSVFEQKAVFHTKEGEK